MVEWRKEIDSIREAHQGKWEAYKKDMDEFMEGEKERRKQRCGSRRGFRAFLGL